MINFFKQKFASWRMAAFLLVSVGLTVVTTVVAPHLLPVTAFKIALVTFGGWLGYWLDRVLFPGARPAVFLKEKAFEGWHIVYAATQLRRAIIIFAVIMAICLAA